LGCIAAPWLAERLGRRSTLALYYFGMMVTIALVFGWAFYLPTGPALPTFMAVLFFLGVFGATFRFSAYDCRSCSAPKRAQLPSPSARRSAASSVPG
jgi:MFS family permease